MNAQLVTRGNNAKKVRLTELFCLLIQANSINTVTVKIYGSKFVSEFSESLSVKAVWTDLLVVLHRF